MPRIVFVMIGLVWLPIATEASTVRVGSLVPPLIGVPERSEGIDCVVERGLSVCARFCSVDINGHQDCRGQTDTTKPRVMLQEPQPVVLVPLQR